MFSPLPQIAWLWTSHDLKSRTKRNFWQGEVWSFTANQILLQETQEALTVFRWNKKDLGQWLLKKKVERCHPLGKQWGRTSARRVIETKWRRNLAHQWEKLGPVSAWLHLIHETYHHLGKTQIKSEENMANRIDEYWVFVSMLFLCDRYIWGLPQFLLMPGTPQSSHS